MKIPNYAILAAVLFGVGMSVLLFFSTGPPRGAGSVTEESPAPEVEREPGVPRTDGVVPEPPNSGPRIEILDSAGGSRPPASGESLVEASRAIRARSGLTTLQKGSGEVLFAVEDASGRELGDVSLTLRQLDLGGGSGHAITGARGDAHFFDLAPGPYSYRAQTSDRTGGASEGTFVLDDGERKHITVRLGGSNLSIAGRVLNRRGEQIPGIEVSAVRHRFASSVSEDESGDGSTRRTLSRDDGSFKIEGLTEGEYEVHTTATQRYAPLQVTLQAGAGSTDLILVEGFAIDGMVTNEEGELLAGVWVGLRERRDRFTYTDNAGRYRLQLDFGAQPLTSTVRFYLAGYEEQLLGLPAPEREGAGEFRLDAELHAVEDGVSVVGIVRTERGDPVDRATVLFGSPELGVHHQAMSDADGNFAISNVVVGAGYQLRVLPASSYLDYSRERIRVPEDGLSLEVVLEALATGRLTGRMIDVDGSPVPGFRLWLLSSGASRSAVPFSSDERGYFEMANAPAGSLTFDTRASPHHTVSGVFLPAEGEIEVSLILDWGTLVMTGGVLDDRGDPVGGAEVSLSWSDANGEIQSKSSRATRTDPSGLFRFSQLGPGEHLLEVRAAGYRTLQARHDVGQNAEEVELRLESDGS